MQPSELTNLVKKMKSLVQFPCYLLELWSLRNAKNSGCFQFCHDVSVKSTSAIAISTTYIHRKVLIALFKKFPLRTLCIMI